MYREGSNVPLPAPEGNSREQGEPTTNPPTKNPTTNQPKTHPTIKTQPPKGTKVKIVQLEVL